VPFLAKGREIMTDKKKLNRVKRELKRISGIFENIEEDKRTLVDSNLERLAFMRVQLEDLEQFLFENGWTAPFQQSAKVEPYDRQRPEAQIYTSLVSQYNSTLKVLLALLPEKSDADAAAELMEFLAKG
jgi:hypothetical protein